MDPSSNQFEGSSSADWPKCFHLTRDETLTRSETVLGYFSVSSIELLFVCLFFICLFIYVCP